MERVHFYNFHDLLKVQIIIQRLGWFDSYLEKTFRHYEVDDLDQIDLSIEVGPFSPKLEDCAIVDGKYFIKRDYIFYKSSYKMGWWETEIEGIERELTQVRIQCNAFGRMVIPGETIYNLIRFKLGQKGYPLLHGSAVGKDGMAYMFSARGGTGKTISTLNFVKMGFDFYSDDSVILGDHEIFGFIVPFNLRFTYDIESLLGIKFSSKTRRELFLKRLIYFLTLGNISLFTTLEAKEVFPHTIQNHAYLKKVFILFQGPTFKIEKKFPSEWGTTDLLVNMQFECPELIRLLLAYSYCFPQNPLTNFWEGIVKQIANALKGVEMHRISIPVFYSQEIFNKIYEEVSV
jgi:hypothetical protein